MSSMPRLRRPSLFTLARVAVYLLAPIPLTRWWYDGGPTPALKWYFQRAAATTVPPLGDALLWEIELDIQFNNLERLSFPHIRPLTRPTCAVIAQTLGVIGAASALSRAPHRRPGDCPDCGYDLKGLSTGLQGCVRCPECGTECPPRQSRTDQPS